MASVLMGDLHSLAVRFSPVVRCLRLVAARITCVGAGSGRRRVVKKIPDGSAVVFVFGEIDCREGILVAVEKMRYASVEEGMEHTVGIFVEVAEQLVRKRRIRAFIHPVVPVLDETRAMVKAYNSVFRRKVDASGLLSWLDFFEDLLDESGNELRQEYCLDGTHLEPSYLRLLERALNNVWREQA